MSETPDAIADAQARIDRAKAERREHTAQLDGLLARVMARAEEASVANYEEHGAELGEPEPAYIDRYMVLQQSGLRLHEGDEDRKLLARLDIKRDRVHEVIHRWVDRAPDGRRVLILTGGTGAGKTFAAGYLMALRCTGVACMSVDLGRRLAPYKHELEQGVRPLSLSERLIVLDDLGTEDTKDRRWADAWVRFVERRQSYGETVITTNLDAAALRARYADERIIDRLDSCAHVVTVGDKSKRKKGGGMRR